MKIKIASWNINSVRLRTKLIVKLMEEEQPDIIGLQELKYRTEVIDTQPFVDAGYPYFVARGQKSYNGVAFLSRLPLQDMGHRELLDRPEARHLAVALDDGAMLQNFYVPAGGDVPDREENSKFGDKLDFLSRMRDWFASEKPRRTILVGDLNIAPREDDVWSHRHLLRVVSHTPVETALLEEVRCAGNWTDVIRHDIPQGQLYSWWSYRARNWDASDRGRRLDHIWATPDLVRDDHASVILRAARGWERPSDHVPVIATFET